MIAELARRRRAASALVGFCLSALLVGCEAEPGGGTSATPEGSTTTVATTGAGGEDGPSGEPAGPDRTRVPTTTASGGGTSADAAVDDGGAVSSAGRALLSDVSSAVLIEVDRSPGADLAIDPRAVLGEELREHGGKQSVAVGDDSAVPAQQVYTAADLLAITEASRGTRSEPGRPAVYVLLLEGRFEDERVTGVAFQATTFAIFTEQIGGGLVGLQRETFEEAVVVHELGHLVGLVNLTGHGAFHEDPDHPGHSPSRESVMYWAIEDVSIRTVFRGGPPTEFDAADVEEMAKIRSE